LRRDWLFLVAGVVGLATAALGAIGTPRIDALGMGAAATVDGRAIPREAATRAVMALANDKRNLLTPQDEAAALERLIEEELLVQRGIELGLAETDLAARKAIVQSVLQLAVAERAGEVPDDATLRRFYAENAGLFAAAPRVRTRVIYLRREPRVAERARGVEAQLLEGKSVMGDPQALELPRTPLSPSELRAYLGTEFTASILAAQQGQIVRSEDAAGIRLALVEEIERGRAARFEEAAEQVRAEWDRRADEAAVRAYVDRLKRRARISRAS
jgi:hypothetical protein